MYLQECYCITIWNHQPHGCLLNRLFRRRSKKTSELRVTGLCVGNSPGPVNSPHKGPVTRKMFPFDDVIMGYHRNCAWLGNMQYTRQIFTSFIMLLRFGATMDQPLTIPAIYLPIFFRIVSLALGQAYDWPAPVKVYWKIWLILNHN